MKAYQVSVLFFIPEQESWVAQSVVVISDNSEKYITSMLSDDIRERFTNPQYISVSLDEMDQELIDAIKEL